MKQQIKYCSKIEKLIPDIKKNIDQNLNKQIMVSSEYLENLIDPKYSKNPASIYIGIKGCLFRNGIYIEPKKGNHTTFFLLRSTTPDDKLMKL